MAEMTPLEFKIVGSTGEAANSVDGLSSKLKDLKKTLKSGFSFGGIKGLQNLSKKAHASSNGFRSLGNSVRKASSNVGRFARNMAALPFRKSIDNAKRFAEKIGSVGSSFKRVMFYRAVRTLIKEIGDAFKIGVDNMYAWSQGIGGTFAANMDRMATSLQYFKNSIGAAVAPLLNALAPALDVIIDRAVAALNVINQLFARLTGASYWTRATKQATSYGDAVAGAGGAAKEAMKYLAPFDELNVLPDNNSGGGGGGGGGADTGGMFEELVEFNEEIADFADKLRDAIERSDWQGVGELLGTKINEIIDEIPWRELGEKFGYWMNAIISTEYWTLENIDFENLGEKVQEALNAAIDGIDWEIAGALFTRKMTALGDFLIGAINNADSIGIGEAIENYISGAINEAQSWLQNHEFTEIGERLGSVIDSIFASINEAIDKSTTDGNGTNLGSAIADFINGAINGIEINNITGAISGVFKSVFENFDSLLSGIEWGNLANAITVSINDGLRNIDAEEVGASIGSALNGVVDIVSRFVNGLDWTGVGSTLAGTINGFLEETDFSKIGDTVAGWFTGIADVVIGFIQTLDFGTIASSISELIVGALNRFSSWLDGVDWIMFGENLFQSLNDALKGIKWDELGKSFAELCQDAFFAVVEIAVGFAKGAWDELKSEWDERMAEYNGSVINVVASFELDALLLPQKIEEWVNENFKEPLEEKLANLFGVDESSPGWQIGTAVYEGMEKGFLYMLPGFGTFLNVYDHFIKPVVEKISTSDWSEIGEKIKEKITTALDNIGAFIDSNKADELIGGLIDDINQFFFDLDDKISDWATNTKLATALNELPSKLENGWTLIKAWFSDNFVRGIEQFGIDAANGLVSAIQDGINKAIDALNKFIDNHPNIAATLGLEHVDPIELKLIPDLDPPVGTFYEKTRQEIASASKNNPTPITITANMSSVDQTVSSYNTPLQIKPPEWSSTTLSINARAELIGVDKDKLTESDRTIQNSTSQVGSVNYGLLSENDRIIPTVANFTTATNGNLDRRFTLIPTTAEYIQASQERLGTGNRTIGTVAQYTSSDGTKLTSGWRTIDSVASYTSSDGSGLAQKWRIIDSEGRIITAYSALDYYPQSEVKGKIVTAYSGLNYYPEIDVIARIASTKQVGKAGGGVYSGGAWHDITAYASGGFPGGGQLFLAREAGPELVGTLRGHTAVMNNNQIVASVSAGVARAISSIQFHLSGFSAASNVPTFDQGEDIEEKMYRAVMRALSDSDFAFEDDINIDMDGESIYQGMVRRNKRNTSMTGVNAMA